MEYHFEEVVPEEEFDFVSEPQLMVLFTKDGRLKVIVYLMINTAHSITKVIVMPGKIICKPSYPQNIVCASQKLTKLIFTFPDSQGMNTDFQFIEK